MNQYEYQMTREGLFQPIDKNLPELDLRVKCDYWKQFEKSNQTEREHRHFFLLQHGGLGLWQLDPRPLDTDIEIYLKKHPEQRRRR
jgi:hypothetical protein